MPLSHNGSAIWIQIILVIAICLVTVLLTRSTAHAQHQAIRRLLLVAFVVAAIVAVIFPNTLTFIATAVGVGRGTDLLLYALVVAFIGYLATSYRRTVALERKITLLTRELCLHQSEALPYEADPEIVKPASPTASVSTDLPSDTKGVD